MEQLSLEELNKNTEPPRRPRNVRVTLVERNVTLLAVTKATSKIVRPVERHVFHAITQRSNGWRAKCLAFRTVRLWPSKRSDRGESVDVAGDYRVRPIVVEPTGDLYRAKPNLDSSHC